MPQNVPYKKPTNAIPAMVREQDIETEFQQKLESLEYTNRPDIHDRASLEKNFREKFEALNHVHLTDSDKYQFDLLEILREVVSNDVVT